MARHRRSTLPNLNRFLWQSIRARNNGVRRTLQNVASTAVRMANRYGHIRPEVQRQAPEAIATAEFRPGVNQIVHQVENEVKSNRPN
jgi:hypothetical protein